MLAHQTLDLARHQRRARAVGETLAGEPESGDLDDQILVDLLGSMIEAGTEPASTDLPPCQCEPQPGPADSGYPYDDV